MTLHHGQVPKSLERVPGKCVICGEREPFHVHNQKTRVDDYFLVGRGQTPLSAAKAWKEKYLELKRQVGMRAGMDKPHHETDCPVDGCSICMPSVSVVPAVKQKFPASKCPYCYTNSQFIWMHGHLQCDNCRQNIQPCCEGENFNETDCDYDKIIGQRIEGELK